LSRQKSAAHGNAALTGFFVWELLKIVLTVAMLVAAPRLIADLSWLALLAGFVVTMKVYWLAMWLRLAPAKSLKNI
jgi:ATP synthase protein I